MNNKPFLFLLLSACLLSAATLARPIRGASAASSEEFPAIDLPYDAEVEYLESTGEQYIQTDYTPSIFHDFTAIVAMMDLDDGMYASALGTARAAGNGGFIPLMTRNGSFDGWQNSIFVSVGGREGDVHTITSKLSQDPQYPDYWRYIWYDRDRYLGFSYASKSNPFGWSGKMTIFACSYNDGTVTRFSKSRFYGFSAVDTDTGEEVVDLIPVRIGEKGYIYDRPTGTMFGNSGTGELIVGPDKE